MIQNDQIHTACSSTIETTTIDEEHEPSAETPAIDEEYERRAGHQMHLLSETLKQLEGDDRLGEAASELREALGALDDAYMAIYDFDLAGASDEDAAARKLVEKELAAINRRLDMLLALAAVRNAARTVGRIACRPEAVQDDDDAGEHCAPANDAE